MYVNLINIYKPFFFLKSIFKYLFKHLRFYKKKWLVDIIKINLDIF